MLIALAGAARILALLGLASNALNALAQVDEPFAEPRDGGGWSGNNFERQAPVGGAPAMAIDGADVPALWPSLSRARAVDTDNIVPMLRTQSYPSMEHARPELVEEAPNGSYRAESNYASHRLLPDRWFISSEPDVGSADASPPPAAVVSSQVDERRPTVWVLRTRAAAKSSELPENVSGTVGRASLHDAKTQAADAPVSEKVANTGPDGYSTRTHIPPAKAPKPSRHATSHGPGYVRVQENGTPIRLAVEHGTEGMTLAPLRLPSHMTNGGARVETTWHSHAPLDRAARVTDVHMRAVSAANDVYANRQRNSLPGRLADRDGSEWKRSRTSASFPHRGFSDAPASVMGVSEPAPVVRDVTPVSAASGVSTNNSLVSEDEGSLSAGVRAPQAVHAAAVSADGSATGSGQFDNAIGDMSNRIDSVDRSARRGIAAAAALNVATPYLPGRTTLNAGMAGYRGQAAVGIGLSHWNKKGTVNYNLALSTAGGNSTIVRVGIGITLGA